MRRPRYQFGWVILSCCLVAGCAERTSTPAATNGNGNGVEHAEPAGPKVTVIELGDDAYDKALEALTVAQPGEVIEFAEGTFYFEQPISCTKNGITIRGRGSEKTFLNFSKMGAGVGSAGIYASKVKNLVIENLAVVNSPKDGIKTEECEHTIYRNLRIDWEGPPKTSNGAYGVYPVLSKDVLVEKCFVRGASDAGVYVGQSENVIVRDCEAMENVAGIEIENTVGADVYRCFAHGNTGGILVFALPELPKKEGRGCRVFDNICDSNNHENFGAPGSVVSSIPPGTGVMIMANKDVHVYKNQIKDNQSVNLAIISYVTTGRTYKDEQYDAYPGGVFVHDNTFSGGGNNPQSDWGEVVFPMLKEALKVEAMPDIVFDGILDPSKVVDGKLPAELGIYLSNNEGADMVNITMVAENPEAARSADTFAGSLPEPAPIKIEGVE